jgi:hypothetical protein
MYVSLRGADEVEKGRQIENGAFHHNPVSPSHEAFHIDAGLDHVRMFIQSDQIPPGAPNFAGG